MDGCALMVPIWGPFLLPLQNNDVGKVGTNRKEKEGESKEHYPVCMVQELSEETTLEDHSENEVSGLTSTMILILRQIARVSANLELYCTTR